MHDAQPTRREPPKLPRWTLRFAIATWIATATLVSVFSLFWRIAYAPPHAVWAIVTTGAVVVAGALTVLAGLLQFARGPRRTITAATVLLGTTPIVWFAMFLLFLFLAAQYRKVPINRSIATCIAGFWSASIADVEARWRYPRWTSGRHVVLLDDGHTPEPAKLVAQMDEHIEVMAARLHAPVPAAQARWVRGSLLWQHGRALLTWAICDEDRNSPELTYTDRHELAHVTIAMLGDVDQDPPMLLCEGWAETQSKDRADLILALANMREQSSTYSLQDLIGPDWYGRSAGPAYHHGGPLVIYLIEHYGPEKFLNLYHGVRPATFATDCERILGDSWIVVEQHFWQWHAREAARLEKAALQRLRPLSQTEEDVQLTETVNPEHWRAIVAGYRAALSKRPSTPTSCAFKIEQVVTRPPEDAGNEPATREETIQCVIEDECVWMLWSHETHLDCAVRTSALVAAVQSYADGRLVRRDEFAQNDAAMAKEYQNAYGNLADLGHYLPLDPQRHYTPATRIEAIRPPATPDSSLWEISYVERWPEPGREVTRHLNVDAAPDWSVVRDRHESASEIGEGHYTLGTIFGRAAAIEKVSSVDGKDGEWKLRQRVQELSAAEAQSVRDKVEAMARLRPTRDWYEPLIQPLTCAIAWPAAGLLLLGAGLILRRHKNVAP